MKKPKADKKLTKVTGINRIYKFNDFQYTTVKLMVKDINGRILYRIYNVLVLIIYKMYQDLKASNLGVIYDLTGKIP